MLEADGETLRLIETAHLAYGEVLPWIDERAEGAAIIGVDAPLVIGPNRTADIEVTKAFGRYHAGCYPARPHSSFAAHTAGFGRALSERGFRHAAETTPGAADRVQMEVHPHAASVRLFGLDRIIKYKRGLRADRARGLAELRGRLASLGDLSGTPLPEIPVRGRLKPAEDQIDAVTCAYVAACWARGRAHVFGSADNGYIVIPAG